MLRAFVQRGFFSYHAPKAGGSRWEEEVGAGAMQCNAMQKEEA